MPVEHPKIVSREEWLKARKAHLAEEKSFTRMRDKLSAARRELPWVRIDQTYTFTGPQGRETLSDLFGGRSQLIIQHFMFHPDWTAGCKSCSFWADGYDRSVAHLGARDTAFVTVSRAPLAKLEAFKKRMGWTFKWVSSEGSDFNRDFGVLFKPEELKSGADYNYQPRSSFPVEDAPGISVFREGDAGEVFHTYSCYARGLDMMNATYHYLDLTPKGRDEAGLAGSMSWLRLRDEYAPQGS
jgi:predicted dithiol-disulfide oxidoreductase (DUF899 family)